MKWIAVIVCLLLSSVADAQQPLPSQTAIQIDNVINQWAQTIEAQQKQIIDLQRENAELKTKVEKQDGK